MIEQDTRGAAPPPAPPPGAVTEAESVPARPGRARRRLGLVAVAFLAFFAFALFVLVLGLVAAWAGRDPALHDRLHDVGLSGSLLGRMALRMADTAHRTESGAQLALDYGFSLANLGLAGFLFWLRPKDRAAPLLAFGLVGTAAVFNLQAHAVYEALDANLVETLTHDGFHLLTALAYLLALIVFPDGRLVPRWPRLPLLLLYAGGAVGVGALAYAFRGDSRTASLVIVFGLLTPAVGVVSQAYRYRRSSDPLERQQSRLLFWALSPALLVSLVALATSSGGDGPELEGRALVVLPVTLFRVFQPVFAIIPIALLVGIFRFRLWDVDKLISRTLVYGLLAGFVSAVYVAVVVGLGSLVGTQEQGNLPLSIVATFLVAVAFHPVKERVQRLANRLVYGKRATPYEVLSEFSERVAESVPTDQLLARMARVLAEGTGASRADVWLKVGDELRPEAWWPAGLAPAAGTLPVEGDAVPPLPAATRSVAVRHQGQLYGALSVTKPGNEQLSPTEEKLLGDLGRQAGLVLRNLRLTAELVRHLEELKASRQRLVSAQDEARRRLERNLHDGAQQQLVALKMHLTVAEDLADELGEPGEPLLEMLGQLKVQAGDALEELRDLARGVYPPLLAAEGLRAALASHAQKSAVPVQVEAEGIGRYAQEVEAGVYFCCLEALQNASKYARASQVELRIQQDDAVLRFTVADDGCGFDASTTARGSGWQNMSDRLEALGGTLEIHSTVDAGTRVVGCIPATARQERGPGIGRP